MRNSSPAQVSFFVLSKILEMFDTVLKVLLMKKFLFLHWYHHLMTAWLGWLSLAYDAAPGQWYAGINCAPPSLPLCVWLQL